MISLDCHHPDVEEFIEIKSNLDKVTKANISIRVTRDFLEAVQKNDDFKLSFTREETKETIEKVVKAKDIFDKFCYMNWDYAEPAFLFWDRIKEWNLLSDCEDFEYAGTNPCAEEPLPAGGSCLLGSINLSEFVKESFTQNAHFDTDDFISTVEVAVRGLNTVLDEGLPLHPLQQQKDSVRDWRQIGLGIMGLADMLIKMGVTYGSQKSLDICQHIGSTMINTAITTSSLLAKELGAFPKYCKKDIMIADFFISNTNEQTKKIVEKYGLRNSQLLTIAPTGSTSTMIGVSGGIEPIFANYYTRKTESLHDEDKYYKIFTPIAWQYLSDNNLGDDETKLPNYFITSQDLDYHKRIDMQSVWQHCIDASISSTVNVPNNFTQEQVGELYMYAWEKQLKGITVYRDGCKRSGILTTNNTTDETPLPNYLERGYVIDICEDLVGLKRKLVTGCGSLHCLAFFDPVTGELMETYLGKGSTGGCLNSLVGLSRMISLSSRGGVHLENIIDQLNSTGICPSYAVRSATKHDTSKGGCCPMAIGNALKDMYEEMQSRLNDDCEDCDESDEHLINQPKCPECGEPIIHEGGCDICKSCGYSKCS